MKRDDENIRQLLEELYSGEWEATIVEGTLPEGKHVGYQSGYKLRIGEHEAEIDYGVRGLNCPHNVRVVGNKVFLSYIQ